jgi:hypothetical protein
VCDERREEKRREDQMGIRTRRRETWREEGRGRGKREHERERRFI